LGRFRKPLMLYLNQVMVEFIQRLTSIPRLTQYHPQD